MHKKIFPICIILFLTALSFHLAKQILPVWNPSSIPPEIVIDIGHGGADPGKVGINSALEKDINLSIGLYLQEYLQASGYKVALTRNADVSLADSTASNQKLSDLKNRTDKINHLAPVALISIHQNSYPDENVHGTQVFHSSSSESKLLASFIQDQCRRILNPENRRQIKQNTDYYLFRHVTCPSVIVECGFLSNYKEAALLITEEYQKKTAWAIHMGIVQFLKSME